MNKQEIAKRIARQAGVSNGEAADRLDRVVYQILWNIRRGKESALPGMGKFTLSPGGTICFERDGGKPVD
jgi:nucleoid DNA-binding protein